MTTIPTLSQLYTSVLADIQTSYGGTIPVFGKNFLRAIAGVQAGKLYLLYLVLGNLQKNIFVDTADPEAMGGTLERFGRVKLNRNPFPARQGQYFIQVTGSIGAVISSSQTFKSDDDSSNPGIIFILDNSVTLTTTSFQILVRCLTPGLDGKLEIGDTLTMTSPVANVDAGAVVNSAFIEPSAAETTEEYRATALEAYRLEPQGGAASDYRLWSKDAQGVEQSYAYAKSGAPGEVNLYVEATIADSIDGKGTPSASLLDDVQGVVDFDPDTTKPLEERGRRPLTAIVNYLPVVPLDVDIDIADFVDSTAEKQAAIEDAIRDAISFVRPFVAGADVLADRNDKLSVNDIISLILQAVPGSEFGDVTLEVDGTPQSSYQFSDGYIPYLNSISYS